MPGTEPFRPLVKEVCVFCPVGGARMILTIQQLLRETTGLHTCDMRSTKSEIVKEYPEYRIEPGFSEEDPLWDSKTRESNSGRTARFYEFLSDVFAHDENVFMSFTAHSGAITSILEVVGHRVFALAAGGVIPVLVRAKRVPGPAPKRVVDPPMEAPKCKEDPRAFVNRGTEILAKA